MKPLFTFICVFFSIHLVGQQTITSVPTDPDRAAISTRARRLELGNQSFIQLTDSLTAPYKTEKEKAWAIYAWLGAHLSYDCGGENRLAEEPAEATHPLYYTQQQLENILKTRRTRCDGFSFMFKLMCNLEGIYCSRLEGYARFSGETVDPVTIMPNHAWNAALLDGQWYEIDPTAGAGQCDGKRFQRQIDALFFGMSDKLLEQRYIPITDWRGSQHQGKIRLKF